jgi:uncharacterized protein YjiS (DUF1127 family)
MRSSGIEARVLPRSTRGLASGGARWLHQIKRLTAWIRYERRIRRDINELMALDDRMLADIGLSREQVPHAARHGRSLTPLSDIARL